MSFELHDRKHLDDELRKIARRQLRRSSEMLGNASARTNSFTTSVHESRKNVKKVRAIVTVLRDAGAAVSRKDRRRLKKAARELSRIRDAAAIIETFDRVRRRYPKRLPEHTYALLRGALIRAREAQERRGRRDGSVSQVVRRLDKTRLSAKSWVAPALDVPHLIDVIKRAYRRSRKTMIAAASSGRSAAIHAWRKALKTAWYQLRLAKPLAPGLADYVAAMKRLETALGEDHNLVVLGATLRGCRDLRNLDAAVKRVEQAAAHMRPSLRKRAFAAGRRLHRRDPDAFGRWLGQLSKRPRRQLSAA